jgi:nitrite reductase/ring-hydroxylating ferredoxin subunit
MMLETDTAAAAEIAERQAPPEECEFAAWPASWYLLCRASELRAGPLAKRMLGRDLVAFRTESGRLVVLEGRCPHLGASLAGGEVSGECIRCPFHGWEYASDGRCTHIPRAKEIPDFARVMAYPAVERHGLVFFFNGCRPLFPLPFFAGETEADYRPAAPCSFIARCPWFMVTAHAFDLQHFETVHGRRLLGPLEVDSPSQFARRSCYTAELLGERYYDRFLRHAVSREVEITLTTWGGTFVVITGDFGTAQSRFLIVTQPLEGGTTLCEIIVYARKWRNRLLGAALEPISLRLRRLLTHAYLMDESRSLGSPSYNPRHLTQLDCEMIEFFRWAATLPGFPESRRSLVDG